MESPRQSRKRNLDWSPTNLRERPSKKSRLPSSPRGLSYSSSSDSDESNASVTASTTDSSSNTVYDTSSLQGNVQLEKTEKSESTEKQGDEGDNDDEAIDWEEYHQQSQSSFTSTDEYDEPEQVFDGNPLMNMMSLNNYSMARIRIHTKYSLKRGSYVLYPS
jgi:hypothetical protein